MNKKQFTCTVCNEKNITDMWHHVLVPSTNLKGLMTPKDKAHAERMKELSEGIQMKKHRCFCGGTVITHGHGDDSWDTSCLECDFLYDED